MSHQERAIDPEWCPRNLAAKASDRLLIPDETLALWRNDSPDDYTVTLEGDSRPIATNTTVVFSDLEPRDYSVELSGIADNCSLDGTNRVTVAAIGGETAQVLFTVTCGALTGSLEVRTLTTGGAIDPDGYIVNVDQFLSLAIGVNDPGVTISDLAAGSHIVELVDVAANCVVSDPNPRTMNIRPAALIQTIFEVTCA